MSTVPATPENNFMQKFRMHLLSPAMLGMTRGYLYRFSVKLISDYMYSINPHILLKQI